MSYYLGIDTSNYTTSVAFCKKDGDDSGSIIMEKKLLPVGKDAVGLRQSDAVFTHVKQLSQVFEQAVLKLPDRNIAGEIKAVGVSSRPRNTEASYMPCFLTGVMLASCISSLLNVPLYEFSHQQGHIAAALYSADRFDLLKSPFYAFHLSGGTTECLSVNPDNSNIIDINIAAETLDLNAGQAVDRIGKKLGLNFPCGSELEKLSLLCDSRIKAKSTLKGLNCCLSGLENQAQKLIDSGYDPSYIAKFTLCTIEKTVIDMTEKVIQTYGERPVVFAGGVMSCQMIRDNVESRFNSITALPAFSSDNAAGTAILTAIKHNQR